MCPRHTEEYEPGQAEGRKEQGAPDTPEAHRGHDSRETARADSRGDKGALDTPEKWRGTRIAQVMKAAFACNRLDGGGPGGVWERTILRPVAEAGARRDARLKREIMRMRSKELFGRYDTDALRQKALAKTAGRAFTLEQRLAVALNMGNAANYECLKNGFGWTDAQIADIAGSLSREDWEFVQNTWTYLESFRKETRALARRLTGVEPESVEARPLMTPYGKVSGGYFPIAHAPGKDMRAPDHAQETGDNQFFGSHMDADVQAGRTDTDAPLSRTGTGAPAGRMATGAQAGRGDTDAPLSRTGTGAPVSRVDTGAPAGRRERKASFREDMPLDLSLSVIGRHVFDVTHDIAFRIPVLDVAKILRNREVQGALRESMGPETADLFMPWLQDVSTMHDNPANLWEKALSSNKALTTAYGLGCRLGTFIRQGTGYEQAIEAIGPGAIARGIARVFGRTEQIPEIFRETCVLSPFMAARMKRLDRDIRDSERRLIKHGSPVPESTRARNAGSTQKGSLAQEDGPAREWNRKIIGLCQMGVDLGTWWGAYEKHMAKTQGDMEKSVTYADLVVRAIKEKGRGNDMTCILKERMPEPLLAMFHNFLTAQYAMWARQTQLNENVQDMLKTVNTLFLTAVLGPVLLDVSAACEPDRGADCGPDSAPGADGSNREAHAEETQAEETQAGELHAAETHATEAQTGEAQAEETQSGGLHAAETQTGEARAAEAHATEAQAEEMQTAGMQTAEAQTGEAQTGEAQTGEVQAGALQSEWDARQAAFYPAMAIPGVHDMMRAITALPGSQPVTSVERSFMRTVRLYDTAENAAQYIAAQAALQKDTAQTALRKNPIKDAGIKPGQQDTASADTGWPRNGVGGVETGGILSGGLIAPQVAADGIRFMHFLAGEGREPAGPPQKQMRGNRTGASSFG